MNPIKTEDILFIINPNSGKRNISKIIRKLNAINSNLTTVITQNLKELETTFEQNLEKYKAFVVYGGDGTVNEAIKYLQGKNDKVLAVIPAGSGNGFARELGFKTSLKSLISAIQQGESISVDLLSINKEYCINVAGLGFDSFVAHDFQKRSGRGIQNYIRSTLKAIVQFQSFSASITVDDVKIQDKFLMISIANTRQFGNNAKISPHSKPNDGIFELVLVKPFSLLYYPVFIFRLFTGLLKESKYIRFIKVYKQVIIESELKTYHNDGEPKTFTDTLNAQLQPNKIRVINTKNISK